jgi:hypothetical protein
MRVNEILDLIGRDDLSDLRAYVAYRTRRSRPQLRSGYDRLLDVAHADGRLPEREKLLSLLPNLAHDDAKLRHLLSDLSAILEDFLVCRSILGDESQRAYQLVRASVSANTQFNTHLRRARAYSQARPLSTDEGLVRYRLAWEELDQRTKAGERTPGGWLQVLNELDTFHRRKRLQLACEAVNATRVLAQPNTLPDMSATLNAIVPDDVLGNAYRHAMLSMTGPADEENFRALRQLLHENGALIEANELRDLYQYVLNYSIRAVNQGRLEHQAELFATYKDLSDSGALITDGFISPWDFKNIVTVSIRVGETGYASSFIDGFASHLPPDRMENALLYNRAHILYATTKHRQALGLLRQVDLDDPFYRLDARSILMKVYVALDDHEALFHHLNAFSIFLRRDKQVSDTQRKGYINTIKAVKVMAEYGHDPRRMARLRERIDTLEHLADKGWLLLEVEGRIS